MRARQGARGFSQRVYQPYTNKKNVAQRRSIYENQSKFPRYYDRNGNPIPIKITVNGREVTKVALAISTQDLVMERTAGKQTDDTKIDFTKNSSATTKTETPKVNKQVQPVQQATPKNDINQPSAKSAYLKEVKDLLNEIYEPIFEIDYARMKINFARMTVAQIDGEYTGGAHNLYMFLLSNMIMLPTFHDDYGNTCSIIITVRNSKVTDVSLAQ